MRLFVALELPGAVRAALAELLARLRRELPAARWVEANKVHLTLAFLGDTPARDVPALQAVLRPIFNRHPPLELRLTEAGCFPGQRAARVLWIGLDGGAALPALQREVAGGVAATLGREPEGRRFHPHLTLARCQPPWRRPSVERFLAAARLEAVFAVVAGTLFESVLGRGGARYRVEDTFPLEATA